MWRKVASLAVLAAVLLVLAIRCDAGERPDVLFIHSYGEHLEWVQNISRGVMDELDGQLNLVFHHMNTKRLSPSRFPRAANEAYQVFRKTRPRSVVICDDNGFRLLGERLAQEVPVVFCGINGDLRRDYPWVTSSRKVTGVLERPMIRRTILEIQRAIGIDAAKVMILLGDSATAEAFFRTDLEGKGRHRVLGKIRVDVVRARTLSVWKQQVRESLKNGYALLLAAGHQSMRDSQGRHVPFESLNQWLSRQSPIPVITVHSEAIGKNGLLGGMAINGEQVGRDVGRLLKELLIQGRPAGEIPIVHPQYGELIFSRHELREWGLKLRPVYRKRASFVE